MKFISITKSINIRPDWANISGAALKAGTPLDITGAVANTAAAVGILAGDAEKSNAEVAVVTEGSIDLAEVTASYGELTDDCVAAIKGIAFIGSDGNPIVPSGGGLPDYSEASDGDVLSIEDGVPAWNTPSGGDAFTVKMTANATTSERSCDKTYNEILQAYSSGVPINAYLSAANSDFGILDGHLIAYRVQNNNNAMRFFFTSLISITEREGGAGTLTLYSAMFVVSSNDTTSYSEYSITLTS